MYDIPLGDIEEAIKSPNHKEDREGKIIVLKQFPHMEYPLRVVYLKKDSRSFVITAYPLKKITGKGENDESQI